MADSSTSESDIMIGQKSGITPSSSFHRLPPCRVCGEPATGLHYGANTCGGCKGFFARSLARTKPYVCLGTDKCRIGSQTSRRKSCPKCRYAKCLRVGMSKDAIRQGRYTYMKRTLDTIEVRRLDEMKTGGKDGIDTEFVSDSIMTESPNISTSDSDTLENRNENTFFVNIPTPKKEKKIRSESLSSLSSENNSPTSSIGCHAQTGLNQESNLTPPSTAYHTYSPNCNDSFNHSFQDFLQSDDSINDSQRFTNGSFQNPDTSNAPICTSDDQSGLASSMDVTASLFHHSMVADDDMILPETFFPSSPQIKTSGSQESIDSQTDQSDRNTEQTQGHTIYTDSLKEQDGHCLTSLEEAKSRPFSATTNSFLEDLWANQVRTREKNSDVCHKTMDWCENIPDKTNNNSVHESSITVEQNLTREGCKNKFEAETMPRENVEDDHSDQSPSLLVASSDICKTEPQLDEDQNATSIEISSQILDIQKGRFNTKEALFHRDKTTKDASTSTLPENCHNFLVPISQDGKGGYLFNVGASCSSWKLWTTSSPHNSIQRVTSSFSSPLSCLISLGVGKTSVKFRPVSNGVPDNAVSDVNTGNPASCLDRLKAPTFPDDELDQVVEYIVKTHEEVIGLDSNTTDENELLFQYNTCVEQCRLKCATFGNEEVLDVHTYFDVFEKTGLDVDGRRKLHATAAVSWEESLKKVTRFFTSLPEFSDLPVQDQITLLKGGIYEYYMLGLFKGCNNKLDVLVDSEFFLVHCKHDLQRIYQNEMWDEMRYVLNRVRALDLTAQQAIILKAIVALSPDREHLTKSKEVARIQWRLICCLQRLVTKEHPFPQRQLERISELMQPLRQFSKVCYNFFRQYRQTTFHRFRLDVDQTLTDEVLGNHKFCLGEMQDAY